MSGCSSSSKRNKDSSTTQNGDASPPRPWQKMALKGVVQTTVQAFGSKMVVRAWPSTTHPKPNGALLDAVAEIKRIEAFTNPTNPSGEVFLINEKGWDSAVPISDELAQILIDCDRMHKVSEGKFDITYVPYRGERDFVEDDINKIKNWDQEPPLSPQPLHLMGEKILLLDLAQNGKPAQLRRYNRRHRLNLNGMIRGYAIDRVTQLLAKQKLAGFAVISEGLIGAAGLGLQDPGLMCIENPKALGTCIKKLTATMQNRILYFGTSASLERKGKMFDPTSAWSYRTGGIFIAGSSGQWVQFGLTYGAIADEGRLNTLFQKNRQLNLSGVYFDPNDTTKILGSLSPYFSF
jgi:thiamine biosynthesis lipoprotein ApbE